MGIDRIKNAFASRTGKHVLVGGVAGSSCVVVAGALSGTAIPWAMSAYGAVLPGMGTMHTSAAAGGIAANLQWLNAGLLTSKAIATGGVIGACVKPVLSNIRGFARNNFLTT
jgi:hypothetical protein